MLGVDCGVVRKPSELHFLEWPLGRCMFTEVKVVVYMFILVMG